MKLLIKESEVEPILSSLKDIYSISSQGQIGFNDFSKSAEFLWVLKTLIDFEKSLNDMEKDKILIEVVHSLLLKESFVYNDFKSTIEKKVNELYKVAKESDYYFLTTISVFNLPFKIIKIEDCEIRIHGSQFPKSLRKARTVVIESIDDNVTLSENWNKVSVKVKATNYMQAYEKASKSLEVFRGLLNMILNKTYYFVFGNEFHLNPINEVKVGLVRSIFSENNHQEDINLFWYSPNFNLTKPLILSDKAYNKVKNHLKKFTKKYNSCSLKHRNILREAIVLYADAYDDSNMLTCFLKSWTVLEILTGTHENETVMKRITALVGQNQKTYEKVILKTLIHYRNKSVHEGNVDLHERMPCFITQHYIKAIILYFHLRYAGNFKTIAEYNEVLDNINLDFKRMIAKKKVLEMAIKLNTR